MEPRITIITLGVTDLKRSTEFYRDRLGLPLYEGFISEAITFFQLKGTWLALFPREELAKDAKVELEKTGFPGFTLAHNVDTPQEVDELLRKAEEAGATITAPAEKKEWGGYSGYFMDFDGYLWEVAWMESPFPFEH